MAVTLVKSPVSPGHVVGRAHSSIKGLGGQRAPLLTKLFGVPKVSSRTLKHNLEFRVMARNSNSKKEERESLARSVSNGKDDVLTSFKVVTVLYTTGWISALVGPASLGHANHFQEVLFPQFGALSIWWLLWYLYTLFELQAEYRRLDED